MQKIEQEKLQQTSTRQDAPVTCLLNRDDPSTSTIVRSPHHYEAFTRVGDPVVMSFAVEPILDESDKYDDADCNTILEEHGFETDDPILPVALHPCVLHTGETFILPQVLERRAALSTILDCSLDQALRLPHGQWLKIWADGNGERVEHELLEPQMTSTPDYPEFLWDALEILVAANIRDTKHPLRQLIREFQLEEVPHCSDCGLAIRTH